MDNNSKESGTDQVARVAGGFQVTRILGVDPDGRPTVQWPPESEHVRVAAVVWLPVPPEWRACVGLRVLAGLVGEQVTVIALLDAPPARALRGVVEDQNGVLRILGRDEIVLHCGKAKITLRADGRVTILGGYVLSRATGQNKLQGGSVHIN